MKYWLPITEDELYEWSQCFCWLLPQKPISVRFRTRAAAVAVRRRLAALRVKDEEELLVAEFDCGDRVNDLKHIPFFRVDILYGLSAQRASILQDRYAAFGLQTRLLDESRAAICRKELGCVKASRANDDVRLGALALADVYHQRMRMTSGQ